MKYLVTVETVTLPGLSPQQAVQHLEQRVVPTDEACMKLEAEGKILAGGALTGRRGYAFVVEAASNEEVSRLLRDLPLWSLQKVDVTPLDSFEDSAAQGRQSLEHLKAAVE